MSDSADNEPTGETLGVEMYCPLCDDSFANSSARHCPRDGTKLVCLSPAPDHLIGRELDGRFTIREKLGAGGMGAVYRAWQASVGREVAVKVIEQRYAGNRHAAKRFLREAKLASRLSQPNTVSVIDFGQTDDGMLFLVMELVRGKTLDAVLSRDGRFSTQRTVRLGVQLCDALEAAHALKIVHRDLKPANIIVLDDPPGRDLIKVLDFGLAKSFIGDDTHSVTRSDVVVGTPSYIAPEVVEGAQPDPRTDLYSVGVILYELATGRRPFSAESASQLFAMHLHDPPPYPTELPDALAGAIMRLLEKEPDDRFASAAETRAALVAADEQRRELSAPIEVTDSDIIDRGVSGLESTAAGVSRPTKLTPPPAEVVPARPSRSRSTVAALGFVALAGAVAGYAAVSGWFGGSGGKHASQAAAATGNDAAMQPRSSRGSSVPATSSSDAGTPAPAVAALGAPAPKPEISGAKRSVEGGLIDQQVRITLDASPRAEVWLDGQRLGPTPQQVRLARATSSHEAVFKLKGYRDEKRTFTAERDQSFTAELTKTPARRAVSRRTPRSRRRKKPDAATKAAVSNKKTPTTTKPATETPPYLDP